MSVVRPKFLDSGYVEITDDGWRLKDDAPDEVRREFEEQLEYERMLEEMGVDV